MNVTTQRALSLAAGLALAATGFVGTAAAHGKPAKLATTHLTVKASKEKLSKGGNIKASVTGTLRSHKAAVANEVIVLDERKAGKTKWTATGTTATTDATGKVSFSFTQTNANEQYRLIFAGDTTYKHSHSGTIAIRRSKVAATPGS